MSQGARVSDLVRVRPGPVLPAVWLQGREKRQAWRDRSPGPRTLKEGRGSQCDSADNRRASVAPPRPLLQAHASRHRAAALCRKPPSFTQGLKLEHKTLSPGGAPKENQTAQEVVLEKNVCM